MKRVLLHKQNKRTSVFMEASALEKSSIHKFFFNSDILSSPKNKACKTTYFRPPNIYEQLDLSKHKFL